MFAVCFRVEAAAAVVEWPPRPPRPTAWQTELLFFWTKKSPKKSLQTEIFIGDASGPAVLAQKFKKSNFVQKFNFLVR